MDNRDYVNISLEKYEEIKSEKSKLQCEVIEANERLNNVYRVLKRLGFPELSDIEKIQPNSIELHTNFDPRTYKRSYCIKFDIDDVYV